MRRMNALRLLLAIQTYHTSQPIPILKRLLLMSLLLLLPVRSPLSAATPHGNTGMIMYRLEFLTSVLQLAAGTCAEWCTMSVPQTRLYRQCRH